MIDYLEFGNWHLELYLRLHSPPPPGMLIKMLLALLAVIFILGTIIGSFLTVVVFRLPKDETIVWGRSHCQHCGHTLNSIDLIPLFSFLASKGKCRYCKKRLSSMYPLIEATTGAMFVLAYYASYGTSLFDPSGWQLLKFVYLLILFALFVALVYIDWLELLLPDVLVFSAFAVTIAYHVGLWFFYPAHFSLLSQSIFYGYGFGLGLFLAFLALILVTRGKGMGGGDMKFALVLGAATGWPSAIAALFLSFVSGAVISLVLIALRKKSYKDVIPFGPFLIGSTIVAIVWGPYLVDFYMKYLLG